VELMWLTERVWCKYSNESYDIVIRQYYGYSVRAMTTLYNLSIS
jgi:hypothetical protein